jgi:hypothetical protein
VTPTIFALRTVAVLSYLSRPWSCRFVVGWINWPENPYYNVDRHGVGIMFAYVTTLFLSPIAWKLIANGTQGHIRIGRPDPGSYGVILLILLFMGTPLFTQYSYLRQLPLALSWPIAVSSVIWFLIASYLSVIAILGERREVS